MEIADLKNQLSAAISKAGYQINSVKINVPTEEGHGHLCSPTALEIAQTTKDKSPEEIAKQIVKELAIIDGISKTEIHPSGFINFTISPNALVNTLKKLKKPKTKSVKKSWHLIEIVSANPTGFLHIGHLRNGILGDVLSNVAEFLGYQVRREYLINDGGSQISQLIKTIWFNYQLIIYGDSIVSPTEELAYNTPESFECARKFAQYSPNNNLAKDDLDNPEFYQVFKDFVLNFFMTQIKRELHRYQIQVDYWVKESVITTTSKIKNFLLQRKSEIYEEKGAIWWSGTLYDLEKDEVLIKTDGHHTYFLQDILYHNYKLDLLGNSGQLINIFGADHYGHIDRMKSYLSSCGLPDSKSKFIPIQLVSILDETGQEQKMSKRTGERILVKDLSKIMDYDAVRWYFLTKSSDTKISIQPSALKEEKTNQIYYLQYTHARIQKLMKDSSFPDIEELSLELKDLTSPEELSLISTLITWENSLENVFNQLSPHLITTLLLNISKKFNLFYENHKILENPARVSLTWTTGEILRRISKLIRIKLVNKL